MPPICRQTKGGSCTQVGEPEQERTKTGRPEGLPRTATIAQLIVCRGFPQISREAFAILYSGRQTRSPFARPSDYRLGDFEVAERLFRELCKTLRKLLILVDEFEVSRLYSIKSLGAYGMNKTRETDL